MWVENKRMVKKMYYANIHQKKTGIAILNQLQNNEDYQRQRGMLYNKMINPLKGFIDTKCTKQQNYKIC